MEPVLDECAKCGKTGTPLAIQEPHGLVCDDCWCQHPKTRVLYEQRPPSEGRKLQAVADKCEACGHIAPRNIKEVPKDG